MKSIVEIALDVVDSTQTFAKDHLKEFASDRITCITAEEQTAGRGRFGRSWISPRGQNILATYAFRLSAQNPNLEAIGLVLGLSIAEALIELGVRPQLKWPNDLLLSGKKMVGILSEMSFDGPWAQVFLGVGVDVNMELDVCKSIDQPATSLWIETGKKWDRTEVLHKISAQFLVHLDTFECKGFAPFRESFENLLAYRGKEITLVDGATTWQGICHSIGSDGRLNLYLKNGEMKPISSGEITTWA